MVSPHINVNIRDAGQLFSPFGDFPHIKGVLLVEADGLFTVNVLLSVTSLALGASVKNTNHTLSSGV